MLLQAESTKIVKVSFTMIVSLFQKGEFLTSLVLSTLLLPVGNTSLGTRQRSIKRKLIGVEMPMRVKDLPLVAHDEHSHGRSDQKIILTKNLENSPKSK